MMLPLCTAFPSDMKNPQLPPSLMKSRYRRAVCEYDCADCPGASVLLLARDGKVLFAKGFGLADVENYAPCTTNTNFRLASVTKQFTAMAVMILADRGKLSLDEALTDFFPESPYGRRITVRHLLTHTSGLVDYEDVIPKGTSIPVLDRECCDCSFSRTTLTSLQALNSSIATLLTHCSP